MKSNHKKLTTLAIVPAYNETGKICTVIKKVAPYVTAVVVVDDGSTDDTAKKAKSTNVIVLQHKQNKGAGAAIRTGVEYAIKHDYDVCIPLGGDDQDDPKEIIRLMDKINRGYDFVQGSRWLTGGRTVDIPLFRRITTKIYALYLTLMLGRKLTDGTNGFRAFRTLLFQDKRINLWQYWLDRYELEPYLFYQCVKLDYKVTEVPVTKSYPKEGYTKMEPFRDWWSIARPILYLKLGVKK